MSVPHRVLHAVPSYRRRARSSALQLAWFAACLGCSAAVAQSTAQADAAMIALEQRSCESATDALNKGMANNEPKSFYLAGELFEYGVCLKTDPAKAASVYERAALLGDTDSARKLAVLYARGSGVQQSYKAAGRWYGVMRQEKNGLETPSAESYARPDAVVRTYTEAVHDFAELRTEYPRDAVAAGVTGKVRMRFDPRMGVATVVGSSDNTGLSMTHLGPNKRMFERALLAGYDDAVKALPKPDFPAAGDFATEREVQFDRSANSAAGPHGLQQLRR